LKEEIELGWTQTKPPSNEAGHEKKILVVPKPTQPRGWLFQRGTVPIGEAGAGVNLRGHFHILEREFGIKGDDKPNFKEYFLFGKKWNGRFVVRRIRVPMLRDEENKTIKLKKEAYRWTFWKTKDQSRFAQLLRQLNKRGRKVPNKFLLLKEYPLEEEFETLQSFEWSMGIDAFKKVPEGVLIEGEAIGEEMTRNQDIFVYEELLEGARSLIEKPLELDHVVSDYGIVLDANFNRKSRKVEYQGLITNPWVGRLALDGKLRNEVSVRACWRKRPWVDGYKLVGLYFRGLSLLKDTPPASRETSMKVVQDMFQSGRQATQLERTLSCKVHGIVLLRHVRFNERGSPHCSQCFRQLSIKHKYPHQ